MVGDTVIPARGRGPRDYTDSVFLQRYARRHEVRAQWMPWYHGAIGAAIGYALAVVIEGAVAAYTGFSGMMAFQFHPQQVQVATFPYLTIILPVVLGLVLAARGAGKADEIRFQSQMALHVLKLQELMLQEKANG